MQPGSYTHLTEFFGPVLAVIKARNLEEAIRIANATGYGLTSGLQSLDSREQEQWLAGIRAGNLYVNRGTAGAIVQRQPFGGFGKSAFGLGIKAGGPNYLLQLVRARADRLPASEHLQDVRLGDLIDAVWWQTDEPTLRDIRIAVSHCESMMKDLFSQACDDQKLIGQDNIRRYLPVSDLRICLHEEDSLFEILVRIGAASCAGCRVTVSAPPEFPEQILYALIDATADWGGRFEVVVEDEEALVRVLNHRDTDRLRYADASRVPVRVRQAAAANFIGVADAPVTGHGRVEVLWMMEEQSLSIDYHRYGNLGVRSGETRRELVEPGEPTALPAKHMGEM